MNSTPSWSGSGSPYAPSRPQLSTLRSLARLLPYARPALKAMALSTLAAGVATGCGLVFPLVIGAIIDGPVTRRDTTGLVWWGLALLGLGIGEAGLFFVRRIIIARPAMAVEARMRDDLYAKLQRLPVSFHDRWPAGQLLSRAISDLGTIRRFVSFAFIFLIINILTFVIGVGILLSLSWALGLVVAALALPLMAVSFVFESKYRVLSRRTQDQVGDLATMVEESVLGVRILKAFGQSRYFAREFLRQASALRDTELTKARVLAWLWSAIVALPEAALGIALLLGIREVAAGTLTAGLLVSFFGVAMTLRWPVDSIGWLLAISNETAAATERFHEVMDSPETIRSPERPSRIAPATEGDARGRLAFRDVHFAFADAPGEKVLRGVDLELAPGETVALVGATGSGKTALTALVNRLHDITSGTIELDGVDIRNLALDDLRRRVAVAFEEPILFSASARENVLIGLGGGARQGENATGADDADTDAHAAVDRALRVAQADFVHELPWGLDTRIGEQGLSLSGGQRQRLALARAIVGRPEVLVLDDPLSALDIHTEAAVEHALKSVLATTTSLVIAHRASTVMLADRVALLADGRIAAIGTHSELMATVPAYRALLTSDLYRAGGSKPPAGAPDTDCREEAGR
ncbi:MAG: ABC transporter ATP-binding protein [Actinobacteria bacterium]|nr:ABC transporter ATP-binding protein [Actinomycetota bacterium]